MALRGFIDQVTADGRVLGWACRLGRVERLHVGVFHDGRLVAEAIAHHYRADLLAAGMALGHCAFDARLRHPLAPGEQLLDLALLGGEAGSKRFVVKVPKQDPAAPQPHAEPARWSDADILENLGRFGFAEKLAALGPDRFADAVYQWLHERWAEPEVMQQVRTAVAAGVFDADGFVREVLLSEERQARSHETIASPFDSQFPFVYAQQSFLPAARTIAAAGPAPPRPRRRRTS